MQTAVPARTINKKPARLTGGFFAWIAFSARGRQVPVTNSIVTVPAALPLIVS